MSVPPSILAGGLILGFNWSLQENGIKYFPTTLQQLSVNDFIQLLDEVKVIDVEARHGR